MVLGGRRRRRHHRRHGRRRRGGSLKDVWGKVKDFAVKGHDYVKKNKIASRIARAFDKTQLANGLAMMGYGRRHRRRHGRRGRRGGARLPFNGGANQQALLNAYLKTKVAHM